MNHLVTQPSFAAASLRRLASTFGCDIRLQLRNGFYYVTAFVVALWVVVFSQIPAIDFVWLLPGLILGNLIINTFYFIGGLVLLEKGEGTLEAQIVTPLRTWEYLASKVASLIILSLVENTLLVVLLHGFDFNPLPLMLGIAAASAIYSLAGFIAVARYASINEYLFPSILYTSVFGLPLLVYYRLFDTAWVYLHPLQAPLVFLQAAFQPVEAWQLVYAFFYSVVWIWIAYLFSRRAFFKHIIGREGID